MGNSFIYEINRMSESVIRGRAEEDVDTLEREVLRSGLQSIIENLLPNAPEAAVHAEVLRAWETVLSALQRIVTIADECADLGDNAMSVEAQQFAGDWDSTLALVFAIRRCLTEAPDFGGSTGGRLRKVLAAAPFEGPVRDLLNEASAALQDWEKADVLKARAFSSARDEGCSLAEEVLRARLQQ